MSQEMAKAYNPKDFEDRLYRFWEDQGAFQPRQREGGPEDPFVIVIPPPNVTGVLHMGHGLNNSLQDILIRYQRMQGRPTLWVPGTDHAGIATQNVVDRKLRAQGTDRHDLGREKFLEETWKVKDNHHAVITEQLKKIGSSCDWSRERFTLDEGLSKAVREVFVRLYEKKLIYRGKYLVNWCSSCGTALADDEVEHKEKPGKLYHFRYPFTDGSGYVEIATTRPETLLGDTAVAVHPEDERYTGIVGKTLKLPLTDREIPVVADAYVDREFGTGCVKITPAHDPNDWDIGLRHDLERINILNDDGTLNDNTPAKYRGLSAVEARKRVTADMKEQGFFLKDEDHTHQVGHCYRCNTVVEPYESTQWFVKMKPLAEKALKAWEDGNIRFFPQRWENTYTHWMRGIRDWCISRQLWWGHRIPVWYCEECGEMTVSRQDPDQCSACGSSRIKQDEDVLDTWFSSWLWPFSTLGWPEKTPDLEQFFPTTALVTAYDIIFFWVARMVMASCEFMGKAPFRDIYITPLVRDKQGRKMSKSLGNGIDPLDVVDQYGADALKFTIAYLSAQGQDIPMGMDTFKIGSKFCNKIWNASRYILMNLEGRRLLPVEEITLEPADRWIYHRLNETVKAVSDNMAAYRFDGMTHTVYDFFWNDFCDWYVEASKIDLYSEDPARKDRAVSLLVSLLEESLALLHPFVPFLSEEIYQKLPGRKDGDALITAAYPQWIESRRDDETASHFESLQELVRAVRTLRSEFNITPDKRVKTILKPEADFPSTAFLQDQSPLIASLAGIDPFIVESPDFDPAGSAAAVGKGFVACTYIKELIDVEAEKKRLAKNIGKTEKLLTGTEKKLSNQNFLARAPEDVVVKEKEKLEEFKRSLDKMKTYLADLDS